MIIHRRRHFVAQVRQSGRRRLVTAGRLRWSSKALSDLVRLHQFLAAVNKPAAARVVKSLTVATAGLIANPRIGEKLEEFVPGEVQWNGKPG